MCLSHGVLQTMLGSIVDVHRKSNRKHAIEVQFGWSRFTVSAVFFSWFLCEDYGATVYSEYILYTEYIFTPYIKNVFPFNLHTYMSVVGKHFAYRQAMYPHAVSGAAAREGRSTARAVWFLSPLEFRALDTREDSVERHGV